MTNRAYALVAMLVVLLFGLLDARFAHAQTVCTLDANAAISMVFAMPAESVLAQAFALGLFTPLTGYLVAYFVGVLVNMWKS